MTTDPTPLQERIRAAMHEADPDILPCEQSRAAAILPLIAAEVRKAQADAWDEGQASGWNEAQEQWQINGAVGDMWKHADTPNPHRDQEA